MANKKNLMHFDILETQSAQRASLNPTSQKLHQQQGISKRNENSIKIFSRQLTNRA